VFEKMSSLTTKKCGHIAIYAFSSART